MTNTLDLKHGEIKRLEIEYPRGIQTVDFDPRCDVNGNRFLGELISFGWNNIKRVGTTLRLRHEYADHVIECESRTIN
jgi:hypothetical protein